MTGERRLNYGTDETDARWSQRHDTTNGRFIIAEDTDGATVLLEYDESASEFVYRGPVNMNGNDVTNIGALDATSVSTENLLLSSDINGLAVETVTLSDDEAASFSADYGTVILSTRDDAIAFGLFQFAFSGFVDGATGNISFEGATTLSGTSGPDGTLNLSANADTIYVENRTGFDNERFTFYIFGH